MNHDTTHGAAEPAAGAASPVNSGNTPSPPARADRLRPWLGPLVVACFAFALFSPFFLQGKVFLAADTLYQHYPWKAYAPKGFQAHNTLITDPVNQGISFSSIFNQEIKRGHLLTWSPNILGGVPTSNSRNYPPSMFFHLLFPTHVAVTLILFTHLLFMGLFMHLYLKEIGAGSRGAVFGAVAFMFNGCALVWLSFETVIPNAAYVPLLLFIMERFQSRRKFLYASLGAIVLGLVILLGHIQYLLYVSLLLLSYGVFLLVRAWLRKAPPAEYVAFAACAAITAVGGLLIGALELLPTYEAITYSSRVSRSFNLTELFTILGSVPYRWLVTLAFPDYFGSPVMRFSLFPSAAQGYLNYNELCLYLRVPTLFAFLALAVRPRTGHARFFLGLTVLTTAMLAGSFLFYPFFAWYPGLGKLNPTRMIFIFVFAAAAAAGLGIRNIEEADGRQRWVQLAAALGLTGVVVFLAFTGSSRSAMLFFNSEQFANAGTAKNWAYDTLRGMRALTSPTILKPLALTLAAGALVGTWVWCGKRRWALLFPALLTGLLGYDLISFGWNYNTLAEPRIIFPMTPSIAFLQQQPGPFRVVQDGRRGLFVNALQPYGIQEVGGYMSVYPERVNKLMSLIEYGPRVTSGAAFDRWVVFGNVGSPLLDLLNVRYVLTAPGVRPQEGSKYRLAFSGDLSIYENLHALPRAFAVHRPAIITDTNAILAYMGSGSFDPRAEVILEEAPAAGFAAMPAPGAASAVTVDRYAFDEVALTAGMAANGWVVLSDSYYPGWEAEVDGKAVRILRADCALRAVPVAAGTHRVVFRFRPASISRGRAISLVGLLFALGGMAGSALVGRRADAGVAPPESGR